ncbi:MAG: signal recognition particle-docking protein FtsY [Gammaproteobacteria bacterium]|nr:signal recognition particle-docking protein FtsY [Gammaproteobacteria bacterium]MYD80478.1 signal recognition particle-docking protein FtsY [Gammaproteobacteria bacterium]
MPDTTQTGSSAWNRFRSALAKTRNRMADGLGNLLSGNGAVSQAILDDLETCLLMADVGTQTAHQIVDGIRKKVTRRELKDQSALSQALEIQLLNIASSLSKNFEITSDRPFVVLVVGVNGVGKTTTIGKLAHKFKSQGHSVMLAAGDTYRAAAIEQLASWANRNEVALVAQKQGSDSASVVHDALQAAKARSIDVLLADTAGRLHSKSHLMEELAKVRRVVNRLDSRAPQECILVLDATAGQNTLAQIREFDRVLNLSGLVMTKLDGSAKGGVVLALPSFTSLPLYFVGLGEEIDALREFNPQAYISGLLST